MGSTINELEQSREFGRQQRAWAGAEAWTAAAGLSSGHGLGRRQRVWVGAAAWSAAGLDNASQCRNSLLGGEAAGLVAGSFKGGNRYVVAGVREERDVCSGECGGIILVGEGERELPRSFLTPEEVGGRESGSEEQQRGRRFDPEPLSQPPAAFHSLSLPASLIPQAGYPPIKSLV